MAQRETDDERRERLARGVIQRNPEREREILEALAGLVAHFLDRHGLAARKALGLTR